MIDFLVLKLRLNYWAKTPNFVVIYLFYTYFLNLYLNIK